jgi:hypothetical protein
MARKTIVALLVGLALTSYRLAEAQQQAKVAKIGWLATGPGLGRGPGVISARTQSTRLF